MVKIKLFLSHASEDQPDFVRPLAEALLQEFDVWYSEYSLTIGDKLREKIDEGLKACDFGVVVLSPAFFEKKWPKAELDGLFQLESDEKKLILPIWKDVDEADVKSFSPILASRLGADASKGVAAVVMDIRRSVGAATRTTEISTSAWKRKFEALDGNAAYRKMIETLSRTDEGLQLVRACGAAVVDKAKERVDELNAASTTLKLRIKRHEPGRYITIVGPRRLMLALHYDQVYSNSIDHCDVSFGFFRERDYFDKEDSDGAGERWDFSPSFDPEKNVIWKSDEQTLSSGDALLDLAFEKFFERIQEEMDNRD